MEKLRDFIIWSDGEREYERNLIEKVRKYKTLVIFGAGIGGNQTLNLLKKHGYGDKVVAFSDNNENKIGKTYLSIPVVSPSELKREWEDALVLVSSMAYDIILKQLVELGIDERNVYYFQPAGMSLNTQEDMLLIRNHIDELETVFELLKDEKSRKIYRCLLNYRIAKDTVWLENMKSEIDSESRQYFDREILKKYEFKNGFVDGGAYLGDTMEQFYTYFPEWEGKYYCIEAGKEICRKLRETIRNMQRKNATVYEYALWDSKTSLHFDTSTYGAGAGSRVSKKGEEVEGISLDELMQDKEIDFIKLDIEGAERRALLGAKEIIKKNRPIITACIYHKPEDFFDIPLLIREIAGNEYDFYIRQYRYGQSETVLYAMPKSRLRL